VIRAIFHLLGELAWSFVHRVLDPYATWDHEEDDRTTPRNVADWIGDHKPSERR
jgi:hypothetical protein